MTRAASDRDLWDDVWSGSSYGRPALRRARARVKVDALAALGVPLGPGGRVLDLACGAGWTLVELASRYPRGPRWIACDRSVVATRAAASTFRQSGLDAPVLGAEGTALPFRSASIDTVLASMVLQHVSPPERVLAEVARVLVPGGRLVVVAPNRHSAASLTSRIRRAVDRPPYDRRTYSDREMRALLDTRFHVDACRPWHLGFDRPVAAIVDRALGAIVPSWGRYLVASCRTR